MNRRVVSGEEMNFDARHFDPLFAVSKNHVVDCVLHMSTCFEPRKTHVDFQHCVMANRHLVELEHLRFNIDRFDLEEIKNSTDPKFHGDLIISVNGFIHDQKVVDYLKSIDGKNLKSGLTVKIFQRPNVGYQWGGFYDVWQKYKTATCNYYASFEEDCFFSDSWFDTLKREIEPADIGCVGQLPVQIIRQPHVLRMMPLIFIRDGSNRKFEPPIDRELSKHTRGAFYFCKRDCLERLDASFACFTHAMSNVHQVDGVFAGEIAFSQKMAACGYKLKGVNICQPQDLAHKEGIRKKNV